jgi:hypothetical protein
MQIKAIHVVIVIAVFVLASGASVWLFYELPEEETCPCSVTREFEGSFYVNHAGEPTPDLPCYAEFNVTLVVQNSSGAIQFNRTGGALNVTFNYLPVHCLCQSNEELTFRIATELKLVWDPDDDVWNGTYSDHYIASFGFAAPQAERGSIWAVDFPGLPLHYYVELRLK